MGEKEKTDYELVKIEDNKYVKEPVSAQKGDPVNILTYAFMLILTISVKSWQPLAITASQSEDGKYLYNKTTMVILVEVVKFVFCGGVLLLTLAKTPANLRPGLVNLSFVNSLHFLVPSVLYGASNTLVFLGMSFINPALFHVLGNIRIITTGVISRLFIGRKQEDVQWLALGFMTVGAIIATPGIDNPELLEEGTPLYGLFFIVLMCICSTSASVYTELNFKRTKELSIFYQNIVLYTYGIIVNTAYLIVMDYEAIATNGFFHGYNSATWMVVLSQSIMGVSLSFVFKYLDNIVYVISLTVAMMLTVWLSIVFFEFQLTLSFLAALVVVTGSIYLYYRSKIFAKYGLDNKTAQF